MAITVVCSCGKRLKAPDDMMGRIVRCPACKTAVEVREEPGFEPLDPPFLVIDTSEPPAPKVPVKTAFWKDPVVLVGAAVPVLILVAFFGYLYHQRSEELFRERIAVRKADADALALQGKSRIAYRIYNEVVSEYDAHPVDDSQVKAEVDSARGAIAKLGPGVLAEIRAEVEQIEALARKEQFIADRREELRRLSSVRADIRGKVFVNLKSGGTETLRGVTITLIKADIPRRDLVDILENVPIPLGVVRTPKTGSLFTDSEFEFFRDAIDKCQPLRTELLDMPVDARLIYALSRVNVFLGESGKDPWGLVMKQNFVSETFTSFDGDFRFRDVSGGYYYLCADHRVGRSLVEWVTPVVIKEAGIKEVDLHNNMSTLILNLPG